MLTPSMGRSTSRATCRLAAVLLAGCWLFIAGCTTSRIPRLTVGGPEWSIREGQATWRFSRDRPELGGELIFASKGPETWTINFSKTPLPLINAQRTATNWLVEFPARKMSFGGSGTPPTRFGWLYLPEALSGKSVPEPFHFEQAPDGNWRFENRRSGEIITGYLSP